MTILIQIIIKMAMTCECCDSGLLATKVNGIWVCIQCDNFECKECGVENNKEGWWVSWCKPKQKCICYDCAAKVCGCFVGKTETLCGGCAECKICEGCKCKKIIIKGKGPTLKKKSIQTLLTELENDYEAYSKIDNAKSKEKVDCIIRAFIINKKDADAVIKLYWDQLESIYNKLQYLKKN